MIRGSTQQNRPRVFKRTVPMCLGVISLIATIFDKDNTIFDWFGIGFEISNYIKNKKWKEVVGAIFSYFDEIIAFLKRIV